MDIKFGDMPKFKMRFIAWIARRELRKMLKEQGIPLPEDKSTMDVIHEDLQNCTNPVIRQIYKHLIETANNVKENHQRKIIGDLGSFLLWAIYKDTGYYQEAFWALNKIINDEKIREKLPEHVVEPENWYVNKWHKSKQITKKKQEKGELSKYQLSEDENIFVPSIQRQRWEQEWAQYEQMLNREMVRKRIK
jgi:hypothetical protein